MNEIISTLVELWRFDIWVFSQWWVYAPCFIPATFYLMFFFLKWMVITAPAWLPIAVIIAIWRAK